MIRHVASMAVATVLAAVAPAHAQPRDPWDGPPASRPSGDGPSAPAARPDPPLPAEGVAVDPDRAARIERARHQVLDDSYQAELPDGLGTGSGSGRPERKPGGELVDRDRRARIDARTHDEAGPMSTVMTFVMWGMVIVILMTRSAG